MKKALRIGYNRWYCDENFAEHIAFIKKNQLEDLYYMPQYGEASSYWVNEALKECALVGVGGFIVGLIIGKSLKANALACLAS